LEKKTFTVAKRDYLTDVMHAMPVAGYVDGELGTYKDNAGLWVVVHLETGAMLSESPSGPKAAIKKARKEIAAHSDYAGLIEKIKRGRNYYDYKRAKERG